ncbi:alkaline phosphatase family protein [Burkholderia oklahomensis]|uniref:Phosphoesterase family protein n=1 Tax=Burkholderia oklahomensis TaxID=342113 RepID=A0AAI8FR69_9BURK|nr:alkaline phosphatase family protein [Burkholderia oklahomensis]AIO69627.1 phosphoesterase family protein [Burkholderia oklahomensis]AOI39113.1 phosphoesterase [Burkholderia oklahomensis EO147]KUY60972.1 phosphoesterase [Burkholderia oklahomensis EO147]QPS40536.1 alkaline phosphatase family protein [Burkholderia oklahomensis]
MAKILENVGHVVVVMFENRSFDTMLGWLYPPGTQPAHVLPARSSPQFDGLKPGMSNPSKAGKAIPVTREAANSVIPDPQETFVNVTSQILGPNDANVPWPPMQGFVVNYETTQTTDPSHVMQCHSTAQLPTLTALARAYAVSDAWFASVPSQTWPNRAFAHAGTSNGHVNNGAMPDPLEWHVPTIFDVLTSIGASWAVYSDTIVTPSLTHTMFPTLWADAMADHFKHFADFVAACRHDALPQYAFIEPSFLFEPNDQHPPHDVRAGDKFLHDIWTAVSASPGWPRTLLIATYDEHGGCFDHVLPPANATPPDAASNPGDETFGFYRFGVRVPAVVVSPYIEAGTVFRSPSAVPYDHTSILATLRDWLGIPPDKMLKSARIANAPTLAQLFTRDTPRADLPAIGAPALDFVHPPPTAPLNDLQKSLVTGTSRRDGRDPAANLAPMTTRQHALDFFARRASGKPA